MVAAVLVEEHPADHGKEKQTTNDEDTDTGLGLREAAVLVSTVPFE
jgi:hypothetical protein